MNFKDFIFPLYDTYQIRMILCDRVKLAFNKGFIIEETMNLCLQSQLNHMEMLRKQLNF